MELQEFTIDRKTWLRGDCYAQFGTESALLSAQGERCCVGFFAHETFGFRDQDLLGVSYLESVVLNLNLDSDTKAEFCARVNEPLGRIYDVNDDMEINDFVREARLTKLFAKIGYRPVFVG